MPPASKCHQGTVASQVPDLWAPLRSAVPGSLRAPVSVSIDIGSGVRRLSLGVLAPGEYVRVGACLGHGAGVRHHNLLALPDVFQLHLRLSMVKGRRVS